MVGLSASGVEHHQVLSSEGTVGMVVSDSSKVMRLAQRCGGGVLVADSWHRELSDKDDQHELSKWKARIQAYAACFRK